ncbi:hypothetical protein AB0P15_35640, partial [Streptomyces sp. NPDC087917]
AIPDRLRERHPTSSNYPGPSRIDVFKIRGQGPPHLPRRPAQGNRYAYAADDPINNTDPMGTSVLACIGGGLSVLGGAISFGAGVAGAIGTGGLSTPASLAAIGGGIGLVGAGLNAIDDCSS